MSQGRRIIDALLRITKALPPPASFNYLDSIDSADPDPLIKPIDLGKSGSFHPEEVAIRLDVPAAALADDQRMVWTLYESDGTPDENGYIAFSTFNEAEPQIRATVTGANGEGSQAASFEFAIPVESKRYVCMKQECDAGADVSANGWSTLQLVF